MSATGAGQSVDPHLLPLDRILPVIEDRVPDLGAFRSARKTGTGQSNPTFILEFERRALVLRRKPAGPLLKSAHAVEREFQVIKSLAGTDVPVPRVHFLCEDPAVLEVPFFVMDRVAGRTENDPRCPDLMPESRAALYDRMNATLAALHRVDVSAVGLAEFGRPGDYFARQISRWIGQYRATETERQPELEEVMTWLQDNVPSDDGTVALVHGDWRLDNLLFDPATGAINAVLDWELSTLGQPLADLGAQLMQWEMPVGPEGRGLSGADRRALGIPSNAAYVETYAERAGLARVPDMTFPVVFCFFRMAAILQGVKKRALDGNASNPESALKMGSYVPTFAKKGLAWLNAAA